MTMLPRSWLKQTARHLLIRRGRRHGLMAFRDRIRDLRMLIGKDAATIVDGGANKGDITDLFLRTFCGATIHAFEPIPALAERLRRRYARTPTVVVHQTALGRESGDIAFHVTANVVSSSVLPPSDTNLSVHGQNVETTERIVVRQERLDEALPGTVDVVKLDLQGYELPALEGMQKLFPRIGCLLIEVEFMPMYEGQALFPRIHQLMTDHGYRLFNFYELWTRPSGQLEAADALYINPEIAARVPTT